MTFVFRREDALHDHLVRAPVPNSENGRAKKYSGPGIGRIGNPFDHVEVIERDRGSQARKTTDFFETDKSKRECSRKQNESLHQICVDHSRQTAGDRIDTGGNHQNNRCGHRTPADYALENDCSRIQMHGNFREDHGNRGQVGGATSAEPPFQKFRHGEHIRAEIKRDKNPAQQ